MIFTFFSKHKGGEYKDLYCGNVSPFHLSCQNSDCQKTGKVSHFILMAQQTTKKQNNNNKKPIGLKDNPQNRRK